MASNIASSLVHFPEGMPGGGGMPGMLSTMGSLAPPSSNRSIPSMGGIPSSQSFLDTGFDNQNAFNTNQVQPITYATGIDYTEDSGTHMGKHELVCLKREASSVSGTGHVCKTWTAMNQYLVEGEATRKYSVLKHHAQAVDKVTQGLSFDWDMLKNVQVNQLEKYGQVGYFNENIVNFHVARRVEVFNYWQAEEGAIIREGIWLFALLLKCCFDSDLIDLTSVVSNPKKRKLFDIVTAQSEKNTLRSSSSRHHIAWQLAPYADVSPAGPDRTFYSNEAFCGQCIPIGVVAETYYKSGVSVYEETHNARTALFPTYRGKAISNWASVARECMQKGMSKLRVDFRL